MSIFSSIAKKVGRTVAGFIPGGNLVMGAVDAIGAIGRRGQGAIAGPPAAALPPTGGYATGTMGMGSAIGRIGARAGPMIGKAVRKAAPIAGTIATGIGIEKAFDWFGNGGGGGGRHRRMNPLNPKALTRANRRVNSFADISRRTLKDLGYTVSSHRHVKTRKKKRR